ncbi:MAG: hypothetical protein A2W28_07915 [Gammaproteobacteria bacterium RBG_16_51_14]|nr:MAG: hypothetical protein A2W28_07915 [Gammaproteobacteria bacterium RBG_16_51_14]
MSDVTALGCLRWYLVYTAQGNLSCTGIAVFLYYVNSEVFCLFLSKATENACFFIFAKCMHLWQKTQNMNDEPGVRH